MSRRAQVDVALSQLTEALADPRVDLAASLTDLDALARSVVPSYLGLSVVADAYDARFGVLQSYEPDEHGPAGASLSVELPPASTPDVVPVSVVMYAAVPGAFVDLGADLEYLYGAGGVSVTVDPGRITPPNEFSTIDQLSAINQAIGVLIERGHDLLDAETVLLARAEAAGTSMATEAELILASVGRPAPSRSDPA